MNFYKSIYLMAAPPGVSVVIKGIESAKEYWKSQEKGREKGVIFSARFNDLKKRWWTKKLLKRRFKLVA